MVGVSQSPNGASGISFPPGVGLRLEPNTVLLVNAHFINATDSMLQPEVLVNLHTIPESELEEEGGLLFWYNPFLKVPVAGKCNMRAGCDIEDDIHVTTIQAHMHRRGVDFVAEQVAPDGSRDTIYTSEGKWEDVPIDSFKPALELKSGTRMDWQCSYENAEDRDVYQGPRSTDEMCCCWGPTIRATTASAFAAAMACLSWQRSGRSGTALQVVLKHSAAS